MATITIARFAIVPNSDENIIIPKRPPDLPVNDHHFDPFNAPDLDTGTNSAPPILFFKIEVRNDNANLQVLINGREIVNKQNLIPAKANTFQEIIGRGVLKETGNLVDVINFNSAGSIVVSDFFVLYQAKVNLGGVIVP